MLDTTSERSIPISSLLLDAQNPRLPEIQDSQYDIIRGMLQSQGEKLINLAHHLVDHGPNPASLLIVTPSESSDSMFSVLDGNRRLAALKLLESPSLADGLLDRATSGKLKQLSARFQRSPITSMDCVVVADRDEADQWIVLIHRGQQQGAGLVEWDGQVAARYDVRKAAKPHLALDVLDFVRKHGTLSDQTQKRIDAGKFPITSLQRLLGTPYVRKKLGVDLAEDKTIRTLFPEEEILKGLARVVDDLGTGIITVSKIKSQTQRIDYVNSLSDDDLPDPEQVLFTPR